MLCLLCRWVKNEKIPLHTPLEEDNDDDSSGNKDKGVLFTTVRPEGEGRENNQEQNVLLHSVDADSHYACCH